MCSLLVAEAFKLLQQRVAPAAFHNSAQRTAPSRCHPDTRIAVMQKIYDWIAQSKDRVEWLLWLNGAAGAGKSAIMQSLAERCVQAVKAIASFFFFKGDPTRNTMASLVSTLVYQLIQAIPQTSDDILLVIERNPLIFDQSLESQIEQLIVMPLCRLPESLQKLFIVFIDGLDECADQVHQSDLIAVIGNLSRDRNIPVVFLLSSRREPQIEAAFCPEPVSDLLCTLALDEVSASGDIRRFLNSKFKDIKTTHLRRHLLPPSWPSLSVVEEIVDKSSSQFIFASVVINYVASPHANPAAQLEVIRGIRVRTRSSKNPFAPLDALYQHIFSQVDGLDTVLDLIAYVLITQEYQIRHIQRIFLLETGEVEVLLANLSSVIECEHNTNGNIKFLHASLPDFLRDKSRSERYHIDIKEYRLKLLCMLLERLPPDSMVDPLSARARHQYQRLDAIITLLGHTKASDRLKHAFMNFNFTLYRASRDMVYLVIQILKYLKQLVSFIAIHDPGNNEFLKQDFNDQGRVQHHVLESVAARFAEQWSSLNDGVKEDLRRQRSDILKHIEGSYQNNY
jgi:hypothetical protein